MARLLFFGRLGDIAGGRTRDMTVTGDVATLSILIEAIAAEDEALGAALKDKSVRYAVNEALVAGDTAVTDCDEIAFLPPVSGG